MELESGELLAVESTPENKAVDRAACGHVALTVPVVAAKMEKFTEAYQEALNTAQPGL